MFADPGPGEYQWAIDNKNHLGKFSKDNRFHAGKPQIENPGPGAYTIEGLMGKGVSWQMRGRDRPRMFTETTPGPFEYQNIKKLGSLTGSTAPSFSFGSGRQSVRAPGSEIPGPAHYRPRPVTASSAPSYGFGSQDRSRMSVKSEAPGPGEFWRYSRQL